MDTHLKNVSNGLPTVLAVDDFYLNLRLIKDALKDTVNLYTVRSAADAIKVLSIVNIDLLLLDLKMPDMDGFQFLEYMRVKTDKKIPVIIVSSNSRTGSFGRTLDYNIVDYIVKPFKPNVLREKVLEAIQNINKQE